MHGKLRFELWKQYFQDLMDQTAAAYAQGDSLEQVQKSVSASLTKKYAPQFDPNFPKNVTPNITKAYQVIAFPR
jgi:hypothetical protein